MVDGKAPEREILADAMYVVVAGVNRVEAKPPIT